MPIQMQWASSSKSDMNGFSVSKTALQNVQAHIQQLCLIMFQIGISRFPACSKAVHKCSGYVFLHQPGLFEIMS
jgi:hypothetical protein